MGEKMSLTPENVRYVAGSIRAAWCKKDPEVRAHRCGEAADMLEALAHLTQPAQAVDRATIAKWRNDAFESAAQIVDRHAQHFPEVTGAADDIRALITAALSGKQP